jgi:CHAT domain-containing protein
MCSDITQSLGTIIALAVASLQLAASTRAEETACVAESTGVESPIPASPERDSSEVDSLLIDARSAADSNAPDAGERMDRARKKLESLAPGPVETRSRVFFGRTLALWAQRHAMTTEEDVTKKRAIAFEASTELARAAAEASSAGMHRSESWAQGYRAELYEAESRFEEALILNESALLAAAAINDSETLARWYAQRGRLSRELDDPTASLSAYRLARRSLARLRLSLPPETFMEMAEPIHLALADLLLRKSEEKGLQDEDIQRMLVETLDVLEDLKIAELRDYFDDACLAVQEERVSVSIPETTVLYPVLLEDRLEIVVGRSNRFHRVTSAARPSEIRDEIRSMRLRIQDPTTVRYREPARKLHQWLIDPVSEFLDGRTRTIVIVASGQMRGIPFGALRDAETGQFLIERFPIAITPSLRLTEPRPLDRNHARSLVVGLTTPVEGFAPLPGVRQEMALVEASFPGLRLEGTEFSVKGFRDAFDSRPFGIVHVASHGVFADDVANSFLVVEDGQISMQNFADMISSARFRGERPLQLLTLSACSTATGDDRSILGLAGLAIRAGARSTLATLWPVNDEATSRLIGRFYVELAKPGVSRAVALQRAQKALIGEGAFRHPSFWAPFVLINNWL